MKQIPNFFTLLNLVFGCLAIIYTLQTGQLITYVNDQGFINWHLPENMALGACFIMAAAIVDFLDGFVARLFKATSAMGAQLDSLADVVSFGVAPGIIIYQLLRISFAKEVDGLSVSALWLIPAFLIPVAGAWRLARFNLSTTQQHSFRGVPIPAAGLLIASFPLIIHYRLFNLYELLTDYRVLYAVVLLVSGLMVSNYKMYALKFKNFSFSTHWPVILIAALAVIGAFILQWAVIPLVFILYVALSLIFKSKIS